MPRRRPLLVLLIAMTTVVAACSDDKTSTAGGGDPADIELTAAEQELADAFAASFADEVDGFGVTAEEGDCLAAVLMDELGADPFDEAGVTPEDLDGADTPGALLGEGAVSEDQADAIYTRWEDCVDLNAAFADGFEREYETDAATRECFQSGLEEGDLLREYVIISFTSSEELDPSQPPLSDLISLISTCTTGGT